MQSGVTQRDSMNVSALYTFFMATKNPDSNRQSAGGAAGAGGNNFQSRVAAWWLGRVLLQVHGSGVPFGFPHDALPIRVAGQTGEATDDLQVGFDQNNEIYMQCKTSLNVSTKWPASEGKKNEFASTWIQFYRQIASTAHSDSLALVLVVTQASGPILNLEQILNRFRSSPAGTAFNAPTVAVTKEEQDVACKVLSLFAAFSEDQGLGNFTQHQDRLLRNTYIQVLQVGESERDWMFLDALLQFGVLSKPSDAPFAMKVLSELGHGLHENRSSLDYAGVRKAISNEGILLKDALDLQTEWMALEKRSRITQDEVFNTLGRGLRLERANVVESLQEILRDHRCVVVLGPSGSGKSVVVKNWARGNGQSRTGRVVWLSGAELDGISPTELSKSLGLSLPVDALFSTETQPAYLVVDGVDRCFTQEGIACIRQLVDACGLANPGSFWQIVLTCDELGWERIINALPSARVILPSVEMLRIEAVVPNEIVPLLEKFPTLAKLVSQRDVWSLFKNLKILDLVVTRLENGAAVDADGWVSEIQVSDWWWQKEIVDKPDSARRVAAVLELASTQGDKSRASLAVTELSEEARGVADTLRDDRCWKFVAGTRLDFAHDLLGDWTRHKVLRTEASGSLDFPGFLLARAPLPLWHRAIRLYAAELLEAAQGISQWQTLLHQVTGKSTECLLVGDLLLEGVAFSSRLEMVPEKLWQTLSANGGELLRRFLNRFLHAATTPDPVALRHFGEKPELLVFAATYRRYPMWMRWRTVLPYLASHAQFVAEVAPLEVAKMAEIWFRYTEKGARGRTEMAELAVKAAEYLSYQNEHDHPHRDEPRVQRLYGAALSAFAELPSRVSDLALQLSGCKERPKKPKEETVLPPPQRWQRPSWWCRILRRAKELLRIPLTTREENDAMIEAYSSMGTTPIRFAQEVSEKPEPWPDGPHFEVSTEFRRAFLTTNAVVPMITENPALARKILLASLIEEPRIPSPYESFSSSLDEHVGLTSDLLFESPFYDQGPFLIFLKIQPEIGLNALMDFINFASERWSEQIRTKIEYDAPSATVQIGGMDREWFGDWRLYYGYRGAPWIGGALICALMALERWLHERIEVGEDVSSTLKAILERSRSVGIAGVLVSLGKRDPHLFLGILSPLVSVPEFHFWEHRQNGQFLNGPTPAIGTSQAEYERRREWAQLAFRQQNLLEICIDLFATSAAAREQMGAVSRRWRERMESQPEDRAHADLTQLLKIFNADNWIKGSDDAGNEILTFSPPDAQASTQTTTSSNSEEADDSVPENLSIFGLPERCLHCLEGTDDVLSADPDALWRALRRFAVTENEEDEPPVLHNAGITFPLIAVLLVKCRAWLREHPEAEQLCIDSILKVSHSTVPPTGDQQAISGNMPSEVFYAASLVALWAERPESQVLRSRVAEFAAVAMDAGVGSLCSHAFRSRNALGEGFLQLQAFVVYAAGERSRYSYARALRDKPERFSEWVAKESALFAEGKFREFPKDWNRLRHRQFPMPHSHRMPYSMSTERLNYGIDFDYLVAAFAWIEPLERAESSDERLHGIQVHLRLLGIFLDTFPKQQNGEDHYEGTPYQAELKFLAATARLVGSLRLDEEPDRFWMPLVGLGTSAQHWVQEFLTDFLLSALEASIISARFVSLWREMIDFAERTPSWKGEPSSGILDRERLWSRLLGIDSLLQDGWEQHQSTIREMWPRIRSAIESQLREGESVPTLCRFLRQPFAAEFLGDGLIYLDRLCNSQPDEIFDRIELEDSFASFLVAIRESLAVRANSANESAKAYRALVALLASRQNAVALQLMADHGWR